MTQSDTLSPDDLRQINALALSFPITGVQAIYLYRLAGKDRSQVTSAALARLKAYDWPGNVRELKHTVERAVIGCPGEAIRAEDISLGVGRTAGEKINGMRVTLEEHERRYIRQVLEETGWVIKGGRGAASVLGIPESTLRGRMKKLGIERP